MREALHKSYPQPASERSQRYLGMSVGGLSARQSNARTVCVQGVVNQPLSPFSHCGCQLPITALDRPAVQILGLLPLARDVTPWLNLTFTILNFHHSLEPWLHYISRTFHRSFFDSCTQVECCLGTGMYQTTHRKRCVQAQR